MPEDIKQKVIVETETRGSESIARLKAEILSLGKLGNIGRIASGIKLAAANQKRFVESAKLFDADAARAIKAKLSGEARLARQRVSGVASAARAEAVAERASLRSIRNRIVVQGRLARQKLSEERTAARATAAAARAAITADRTAASERARSSAQAERARIAEIRNVARADRERAAQERRADQERARAAKASINATRAAIGFQTRMARQRAVEEARSIALVERARVASSRAAARAERQRIAEARTTDRERARSIAQSERDAAGEARNKIRLDNYRMRLRSRYERDQKREHGRTRDEVVRHGRDAGRYGSDAYGRLTRGPALAAAAGMAGTAALARRSLGVEVDVDAAEIGTRQYGGLSKDTARDLRDSWAAPLAEQLGVSTAKLLSSWTDAVKLGIPVEGAKAFAGLATQTSEAWERPFEEVSDILGTINSLLTASGEAFSFEKLKSVANSLQYLAAKQSTTPEKLISFLQRGAGGAKVLGMSQEAGLAFGSASTSLGSQAGESGRLLDYVASRLVDMPKLVRKKGDEAKEARDLVRALGYGSAEDMDRARRADPDAFLPDFMDRFSKIKDTKQQEKSLRFFAGREWFGELGLMVKGNAKYQEAAQLAKESRNLDAIGEVWELHQKKFGFVGKQFSAGWRNILGEFGKELSPLARQAGDVFLAWTARLRAGGLAARFRAAIGGFVEGLGFRDLPSLLKGILGEPGEGNAGAISAWRAGFREFAGGIRDVVDSIRSVVGAFAGGSPETIARWTGRILTLSAALVVLSPVLGVLGGIASALLALGSTAATVWAGLKVAGLVGGAGAAGGAIGASALAAAGGIIAAGFLAAIANKMGIFKAPDPSKGLGRSVLEFIDPGLADRILGKEKPETQGWTDPPGRALRDALDEHGRILKQSFDGQAGIGSLIRKANFTSDDTRLRDSIDRMGARVQLAALGSTGSMSAGFGSSGAGSAAGAFRGGGGTGGAAGLLTSRPGEALPGGALGRRGIIGGDGGSSLPAVEAGAGAYKPILDHIARSEGTSGRGDYNASLGYGRFLPGGQEQNLTGKSLNEILALGNHMRRQPGNPNSSALGRYQIVGQTLRRLMRQLGLNGSEKFDEAMQDRLGAELVRGRGANARGLAQEWASLRGQKLSTAVDLASRIGRDASTTPGERPATAGAASAGGGDVLGHMRTLRASGQVINEQCVALAKAAVGVSGSVTTWRKGVGAEEGTLKPGTPIATFLDRNGKPSERYAGGGVGTMGAKRDHAAVFSGYVRDKDGRIAGMDVAEQYRGSGGVRAKRYLFGQGYGEANGSNYHAVLGPDGKPLGGDRNPMSGAKALAGSGAKPETAGPWQSMTDDSKVRDWKRSVGGNVNALFDSRKLQTLENRVGPDRAKALLGSSDILSNGFRENVDRRTLGPTAADLAQRTPFRPRTAEDLARTVPAPVPNRAGGGGNGGADQRPVNITQNIQGHNLTAGELANEVQKQARQGMSWRAHDVYHDV